MIAFRSLALCNEPLLPLTDKQRQAADEAHDYALAHDLVLALETDDHLQYHHSVAADEQRRIPAPERSLAEDHLPPLVLPTTTIQEVWTVPQRVAGVLEAACRWLEDDKVKLYEEAVVRGARPATARPPLRKLKLEQPLLTTNHEQDCAELERETTAAINRGEECVRKHGVVIDSKDDGALFAIPKESTDYAASLEERLRTETMTVSEETIRSLVSLMDSMEWTEKDRNAYLDKQLLVPKMPRRHLSPPLPSVEPFQHFVPEGDVCLVSDASDVSSGISEALEEAERLLAETTGKEWKDEAVGFDFETFTRAPPDTLFDSVWAELPGRLHTKRYPESSLPIISLEPPGADMSQEVANPVAEDDELFRDYINESMFEEETSEPIQDQKPIKSDGDTPIGDADVLPETKNDQDDIPDDSLSDGSCPDVDFQELTEDNLLALEENNIVVEAKLPVPDVGMESSLPDWFSVGDQPGDMLRWILNNSGNVVVQEWLLEDANEKERKSERRFKDEINALAADCRIRDEIMDMNVQHFEQATSWMQTDPDIQSILLASVQQVPHIPRVNTVEEFLEIPTKKTPMVRRDTQNEQPQDKLQEAQAHVSIPTSQKKTPIKRPQRREITPNDPFGDLMSRFKKRKTQDTESSFVQCGTSTAPAGSQEAVKIISPELLLGYRAFADPSGKEDETSAGGKDHEARHPTANIADATSITIDNCLAVQPIDIRTTHLPKAIFSTAIPRAIRSILLQLLPSLEFAERDYQRQHAGYADIKLGDEADIVLSPPTGMMFTTMVGLRQTDQQKRPVFQTRIAAVAQKYEQLHLLIYRNNARPISGSAGADGLAELSPSDAMALAQLQGFVRGLPCRVSASYVGGGEPAVAQWAADVIVKTAEKHGKKEATDGFLVEGETHAERFLRRAGFNVYDAQMVLGCLRSPRGQRDDGGRCIRQLLQMTAKERLQKFGGVVGCPTVLARVNVLLKGHVRTGSTAPPHTLTVSNK